MLKSFCSWLLFLYLIILVSTVSAQTDTVKHHSGDSTIMRSYQQEKHLSILVGYNFWGHHFGELGIAYNLIATTGYHPYASAAFISSEIEIQKNPIIGPKIGVWATGGASGMGLGLNLIYYTDFEDSSLRFRPEIGFGIHPFKVLYGYNIPIYNKDFKGINTHVVSFALLFSIKKFKSNK